MDRLPAELPPLEPDPIIEAYKKDIDRTLLRENLRRTPEERVLAMQNFVRSVMALRVAFGTQQK